MRIICSLIGILFFLVSCTQDKKATMIIKGGDIYTVDPLQPSVEAVAVLDGRILAMGNESDVNKYADDKTEIIDATGSFVMPGFIEGHGHFSGLGKSLQELNLLKTTSWDEIVELVEEKARDAKPGEWITGRGWHQEKWSAYPGQTYFGYPDHKKLSAVSPDNPVMLIHASGHGLFANAKAMEMAQINLETLDPAGGAVIRNDQGEAIGVFEERAMAMIRDVHQDYLNSIDPGEREAKWEESIVLATEECLRKGVTSFQDAGSSFEEIEAYTEMARDETLGIRLWAMIRRSSEEMKGRLASIRTVDAGDHFFTCRAIKTEIDGALGSYGAWLLESYSDKPNFVGQNTTELSEVKAIGKLAEKNDMQLCIHTIGDRGNQEILNLIEQDFPQSRDKRWRMEHAQHLAVSDIPRFAELGVIASMQAIHCTSDSPFVVARLGEERAKTGAYPWRSLLDAGAVVTNGTDAPVEDVDPIASFHASVTRKRAGNSEAFFPEQSMTREEAMYSYTMANAYAAFEEESKGSITVGKLADFVILDHNIVTCPEDQILDTKVLYTILNGKVVFDAKEI